MRENAWGTLDIQLSVVKVGVGKGNTGTWALTPGSVTRPRSGQRTDERIWQCEYFCSVLACDDITEF